MLGFFCEVVDLLPEPVGQRDGAFGQKQEMSVSHFVEQHELLQLFDSSFSFLQLVPKELLVLLLGEVGNKAAFPACSERLGFSGLLLS